MFNDAMETFTVDHASACSRFRYVAGCTSRTPSFGELSLQAKAMQERLELPENVQLWVPNVDLNDCKDVLDAYIGPARTLSQRLDNLQTIAVIENESDKIAKFIRDVSKTVIDTLGLSHRSHTWRQDDALKDKAKAEKALAALQAEFSVSH